MEIDTKQTLTIYMSKKKMLRMFFLSLGLAVFMSFVAIISTPQKFFLDILALISVYFGIFLCMWAAIQMFVRLFLPPRIVIQMNQDGLKIHSQPFVPWSDIKEFRLIKLSITTTVIEVCLTPTPTQLFRGFGYSTRKASLTDKLVQVNLTFIAAALAAYWKAAHEVKEN